MRVTAPQLAKRYGCSVRTIWRLKKRGVDVSDPRAVGAALVENRCPTLRMIAAVSSEILSLPPEPNAYETGWKLGHTPTSQDQ